MSTMDTRDAMSQPVRAAMTRAVLGIVPSAPLEVVLRMMVEAGVRHVPVIVDGHCAGMLHEVDVLWRLWSTAEPRPLAGAVARTPVLVVYAGDDARNATSRMVDAATDVALVLDSGRVVGILTAADLLRLLADTSERQAPPLGSG